MVLRDPQEHQDSYPLNRRRGERCTLQGELVALFTRPRDEEGPAAAIVRAQLIDAGPEGLGVRVDRPVSPGTPFAITGFAGRWPLGAFRKLTRGFVARCVPDGDFFRLGLTGSERRAAA